MTNRTFVEAAIEDWLELQSGLSSVMVSSDVRRLPDNSKASVSIETHDDLAMIEIWEHAACLDTTVFPKNAAQGRILAAGPCRNALEIEQRLVALRDVLLNNGHPV